MEAGVSVLAKLHRDTCQQQGKNQSNQCSMNGLVAENCYKLSVQLK